MGHLKTTFALILMLVIPHRINAQYIYEILDYTPAPGQHINGTAGTPDAAQSIIGTTTGLVSLGAFGGSITFRFEHPVANNPEHPYGIDFTIFGNSVGNWSEPGIVSVMKDENGNGLADDQWFELAGSEYHSENCDRNYKVTYTNPEGAVANDVPWEDNRGNTGYVHANAIHTQPYYPDGELFPGIDKTRYSLEGTRIYAGIDSSNNALINSPTLPFGYADNHIRGSFPYTIPDNPDTPEIEGAGGDPMDINWAVNQDGNSVQIDTIDFIKVHTAVNGHAGILGEISTEVSGAAIVDLTATIGNKNVQTKEASSYRIYPNPAIAILNMTGTKPARFRIITLAGKVQREGKYESGLKSINLSALPQGIYILQFKNSVGTETKTLVKR